VIHSIPGRRLAALTAAALLGLGLTTIAASPASAAGVGYVRLAHLSPDTFPVDVYLSAVNGSMAEQKFPGVAYGTVSKYLALPPGTYQVAMKDPKDKDPNAKALLTTQATVVEGKAYTIAGVGKFADLGLRVIPDDLALPPAGQAKVRVVQASVKQPVLNVTCAGKSIGDGVQFATTTDYRDVGPGKWTIKLNSPGTAKTTTVSAPLAAGSVYSLIVLDSKGGGLTAQLRTDARSNGVPEGGIATGGGGTAKHGNDLGLVSIGAGGLLLIGAAGGFMLRRARLRPQPR
jgi:hypothetical protein